MVLVLPLETLAGPQQLKNSRVPRGLVADFPSQSSDSPEEVAAAKARSTPRRSRAAGLATASLETVAIAPDFLANRTLKPTERLITILGTNDIHGALEPDASGKGGMVAWAGIVNAIRAGLLKVHGQQAAVVLLDGGDQLQGTFISAKNEGQAMIQVMRLIRYDGVVPGNHDYDFGPVGFLADQVFGTINKSKPESDPRGVILERSKDGEDMTPFVSANTFVTDGLIDKSRSTVQITNPGGCIPKNTFQQIDLVNSQRPNDSRLKENYIRPSRIVDRAGLRMAIIGLDTHETPTTTNPNNIADLCFADEASSFVAARAKLEAEEKAAERALPQLYFIATHGGDPATGDSTFLRPLIRGIQGKGSQVHAIVAGHTHQQNQVIEGNVHAVQSAANGIRFGRIDLIYDTELKRVTQAQSNHSIEFSATSCDPKASRYCRVSGGTVAYEGFEIERPDPRAQSTVTRDKRGELSAVNQIDLIIKDAKSVSNSDGGRVMGKTEAMVMPDRIRGNPLGQIVTDTMRAAFTPTPDVAIQNMGGLRISIPAKTTVTFDHMFRMMPFNNHSRRGKIKARTLRDALIRAVQTCGQYPTLTFSGIEAQFKRDCTNNVLVDAKAELVLAKVGEVDLLADGQRDIDVVTSDFLSDGGDGYLMFRGEPWVDSGKVLREQLVELALRRQMDWTRSKVDPRFKNVAHPDQDVIPDPNAIPH